MFWIYWRVMHRFTMYIFNNSAMTLYMLGHPCFRGPKHWLAFGNATWKRKVFAHPESLGAGIPLKCLESLRTVWKVFGQSRFSGQCGESPWTAWKVFGQPGIFLEFVFKLVIVWIV